MLHSSSAFILYFPKEEFRIKILICYGYKINKSILAVFFFFFLKIKKQTQWNFIKTFYSGNLAWLLGGFNLNDLLPIPVIPVNEILITCVKRDNAWLYKEEMKTRFQQDYSCYNWYNSARCFQWWPQWLFT